MGKNLIGLPQGKSHLLASRSEKTKKDNELAKEIIKFYVDTTTRSEEEHRKFIENFDLYAGRWRAMENYSLPSVNFNIDGDNIILGGGKLRHYPIIDTPARAITGDLIMNPLIPIIKDFSKRGRNEKERKQVQTIIEYVRTKFIGPEIERIRNNYFREEGIKDLTTLSIEEQQQVEADVQQRIQQDLPEELVEHLEAYRTPKELIANMFVQDAMREQEVKSKFDTGAEYAVAVAAQYYRVGILHNLPFIEALNSRWVNWYGSQDVEYAEDGVCASYERYITPEDAIANYYDELKLKDIKTLANLYSLIPGGYPNADVHERPDGKQIGVGPEYRVVEKLAANPMLNKGLDVKTREGQDLIKALYSQIGVGHKDGYGIREAYVTWRWTQKVKLVQRVVNGQKRQFIRGEHYQQDPSKGDLEVSTTYIPQVWHGVQLGVGQDIYANVEPIPYQYNDVNNPFDVKLTIHGGEMNTFHNNTKNASFIDLGKPFQYRYNVLMKRMEEHEATDIGKILVGSVNVRPKGWTWKTWLEAIYKGKFGVVANHVEGLNQLDAKALESIDLSNAKDIASDMQKLEYIESKMLSAMHSNQSKFGSFSPYVTNENVKRQLQGADRQLIRFHDRNRKIRQRTLQMFMRMTLIAYYNNPVKQDVLLDDFQKAYFLEYMSPDKIGDLNLYVVDDFRESEKVQEMKSLALSMLQNDLRPRDLSKIVNAESMAEIDDVLAKAERKAEQAAQAAAQREAADTQREQEFKKQIEELKQKYDLLIAERDNQANMTMAELNSMQLANAQDINQNQVSDSLEKAREQIISDERQKEADRELKRYEIETDAELEEKRIKAMKKRGNN